MSEQKVKKLPSARPPPTPPGPDECCNRGCDPCIFDYYSNALLRWQEDNRPLKYE
ncbi:MAG: hypothetical protein ACI9SC_000477 [Gammaproteobacteria bacterium]|jgi:hypothetical protein